MSLSQSPASAEVYRPDRLIGGVPDGMQAVTLARLAAGTEAETAAGLVFVARDGRRMQDIADQLARLLPEREILTLPAW
ncbi:MAG TPA: hypothetical protein VMW31_05495, partial [Devosiaceae bacterium]|nr:hypothetical protein [Devosiaceae bacterium]